MARTHKITTGGRVRTRGARDRSGAGPAHDAPVEGLSETTFTTVDDAGNDVEASIFGIEHKVPLSESVLRATGLHGGVVPQHAPEHVEADAKASHKRVFATARKLAVASNAGTDEDEEVVIDLRDIPNAIFLAPPASASACTDGHDVQRYLESAYEGVLTRSTSVVRPAQKGQKRLAPKAGQRPKTLVVLTLTYGDGETATGKGATTRDALRALAEQLGESFACLNDEQDAQGGDVDA